jgi:hypothetical protein
MKNSSSKYQFPFYGNLICSTFLEEFKQPVFNGSLLGQILVWKIERKVVN